MALLFKTTALAEPTGDSLYALTARTITGEEQPLSAYAGQVALVVNTASKCGFTSQYEGLEKLYDQYRERGFVILGFPSNDFGSQEPGSNDDIQRFCKLNYGVSFPLFEKNPVSGPAKQEVYKLLTERAPGFEGDPGWNFVKFLVNKDGKVVARSKWPYATRIKPVPGEHEIVALPSDPRRPARVKPTRFTVW